MGTVSVKKGEKVLKMIVVIAAQQNEIYLVPLTNTLNDQNGKIMLCIPYHRKKFL